MDQLVKNGDANEITPDAQLRREEEQAGCSQSLNSDLDLTRDRQSLDAGFAKSMLDSQTPRPPTRTRRSDNLEIDMNDAPSSIATPMQPPNADGMQRRMTRVASGAIRQKSVSEILGEAPKLVSSNSNEPASRRESFGAFMADGERSKHSMVVFAKGDQSVSPLRNPRLEPDGYLALRGAQDDPEKDYLRPLFLHQAYQPPRASTLGDLIQSAHKTLTTTNMYANIREGFDYRILRRIYHLQNANKWAFRQMAKFPDPPAPTTHMDHLLAEMKWMRTDFREERKWKQASARRMAESCARYVNSPEDVRMTLRVKTRIPPRQDTQDGMEGIEEPPELDPSGSTDSGDSLADDEIIPFPTLSTIAPATLFNLGYDDVIFEMDDSPASDGILQELPLYESKPLQAPSMESAKKSLIPVSKYVEGKLVPKPATVLRKRSRFDYESEEEEPASRPTSSKRRASEVSMFLSPARRSPKRRELSPEETDVALFDPINRHIRDRLHANHAFRPPSEFPMPATTFFEWRQNSQWTWDEDQKLRNAVKKFSYNWSLIAMDLQQFSQPSAFVAAQERRTPWECFERWEQLEGLPNDMDKTSYFRTYRSRIQAANRNVEARAQAAQQQATQNGNTLSVRRRTETNPFRVQRRKDDRHMMMIGAITKLQRKRETHQHRQQESAKAAQLRKQHNEQNQNRNQSIHTPQEFSRMKHERELKMAERIEAHRQQYNAMQAQKMAAAMQQRMQGQQGQVQGMPNGQGQQQRPTSTGANAVSSSSAQAQMTNPQLQQNGNMQRPSSQGMMQNGGFNQGMPNGMGMQQLPNGQMQGMPSQNQRMTPQSQQDMRMLMAQRQYAMQAQQGTQNNNLAAAHLGQMQSPQMMAALAAQRNGNTTNNGANTQPMNGQAMNATSPRAGQNGFPHQAQQLSSGYQPALLMHQQQVTAQFPHFTPEQVLKLANERLKGQMQRMQANALSAASGAPMSNNMLMQQNLAAAQSMAAGANANGGAVNVQNQFGGAQGGSQSPTQYAAALQRNMAQQAAVARMGSGSPVVGQAVPQVPQQQGGGSRSATPQGAPGQVQRPGSAMEGQGSPRMV
jgi:chromatin modification-related protein VID21